MTQEHINYLYLTALRWYGQVHYEDIVGDTLVAVADSLNKFEEGRVKFTTWLLAIMRNRASAFFHAMYAEKRNYGKEPLTINERITSLCERAEPVEQLAAEEDSFRVRDIVRNKIYRLKNDKYRTAILLHLRGKPTEDIAKEMGVSTNAASLYVHRAKKRLKPLIEADERLRVFC